MHRCPVETHEGRDVEGGPGASRKEGQELPEGRQRFQKQKYRETHLFSGRVWSWASSPREEPVSTPFGDGLGDTCVPVSGGPR